MGKNNRQRRAAKQRRRQRRHGEPGSERTGFGERQTNPIGAEPPTSEESAATTFAAAVHATLRGDEGARARSTADLARTDDRQADTAVHNYLDEAVRRAWQAGWQPADLRSLAGRRLPAPGQAILADVITAETRRYPASTVDPRWREQLDALGTEVWWRPERTFLSQWAEHHAVPRTAALHEAVAVAGLMAGLPRLPRILPPPGTTTARPPRRRPTPDEKVLARIRALLAKAESTEFPEEAEALSSKAQELMTKFSLDAALLEAMSDGASDGASDSASDSAGAGATARRVWLDAPYTSAKAHLVASVASANRCRTVSSDQLGFVTVLGDETSLRLVEMLATSLLVQANRAMLSAGRQVTRYGQSRTRSYRRSFLISYAVRIGERLRAASEAGRDEVPAADAARLLPVLASQEARVAELFATLFPHTVSRPVTVSNPAGWSAGRVAADLATFDTRSAVSDRGVPR